MQTMLRRAPASRRALHSTTAASGLELVRPEFPGLSPLGMEEQPPVFADGASGAQLHQEAISHAAFTMTYAAANMGAGYQTSNVAGAAVVAAREAAADLLGTRDPAEVVFGPSMTALSFKVAGGLRSSLGPGSNVVLDPFSHGANVWPWVQMAHAAGAEVRWLPTSTSAVRACALDPDRDSLLGVIDPDTKLVAVGAASNGCGTVHDIAQVCSAARELSAGGAVSYVDAVHFAPHSAINVQRIGCDFLVCSPYKFFGPHAGILYGRRDLLASLPIDRLDCADNGLPGSNNCHMSRWENGTQSYESMAGSTAAIDYIAGLGARFGAADAEASSRRELLLAAWGVIATHEDALKKRFLDGITGIAGVELLGHASTEPAVLRRRTPTFALVKAGLSPAKLAAQLVAQGVWCTAGNHYAGFWDAHSDGLATNTDGMCRLGFLHYNTEAEIDRVLQALENCRPGAAWT